LEPNITEGHCAPHAYRRELRFRRLGGRGLAAPAAPARRRPIRNLRIHGAIALAAFAGLRLGEVLALEVGDVELVSRAAAAVAAGSMPLPSSVPVVEAKVGRILVRRALKCFHRSRETNGNGNATLLVVGAATGAHPCPGRNRPVHWSRAICCASSGNRTISDRRACALPHTDYPVENARNCAHFEVFQRQ
jgi:hypothetical protein